MVADCPTICDDRKGFERDKESSKTDCLIMERFILEIKGNPDPFI